MSKFLGNDIIDFQIRDEEPREFARTQNQKLVSSGNGVSYLVFNITVAPNVNNFGGRFLAHFSEFQKDRPFQFECPQLPSTDIMTEYLASFKPLNSFTVDITSGNGTGDEIETNLKISRRNFDADERGNIAIMNAPGRIITVQSGKLSIIKEMKLKDDGRGSYTILFDLTRPVTARDGSGLHLTPDITATYTLNQSGNVRLHRGHRTPETTIEIREFL